MTHSRSEMPSWDARKQQAYRTKNPDKALMFHFVLDESPSMIGDEATALRKAFNMYLRWLQAHADPMSQVEIALFSTNYARGSLQPLGLTKPLTPQTYNPARGDGTALYRAIGQTCSAAPEAGQHVLVVFTDGGDNQSAQFDWTSSKVFMVLKTLEQQQNWLCVFLGAYPDSLEVGLNMGFAKGNCLSFATDQIPEAFQQLLKATQTYLDAAPAERKRLTVGGIFA